MTFFRPIQLILHFDNVGAGLVSLDGRPLGCFAIAGADGYDAAFDTRFLGEGRWDAEIFADGLNTDHDATDYVHRHRTVSAGEKLAVKIPADGGYVVRFTQAK